MKKIIEKKLDIISSNFLLLKELSGVIEEIAFVCTKALSNGNKIHYCDVLCQLISQKIHKGYDTTDAIEKTFCEMPAEVVGLLLSLTNPDAITWGRMNFPMHVAFADHGAYLATAPMANPEDAGEPYVLPAFSTGLIYKDKYTVKPFNLRSSAVIPIPIFNLPVKLPS